MDGYGLSCCLPSLEPVEMITISRGALECKLPNQRQRVSVCDVTVYLGKLLLCFLCRQCYVPEGIGGSGLSCSLPGLAIMVIRKCVKVLSSPLSLSVCVCVCV